METSVAVQAQHAYQKKIFFQFVIRPLRKALFLSVKASWAIYCRLSRIQGRFVRSLTGRGFLPADSRRGAVIDRYLTALSDITKSLPRRPKISIVMPVYESDPEFLREALASVALQAYDNWELCAVDDASTSDTAWKILQSFALAFPGKVKLARHNKNQHISATSNSCLEMASGEYVCFLDHDDRFYPHALAEVVRSINAKDYTPEILYSDSRPITATGELFEDNYFHKPSWSPLMQLAFHYTAHLTCYKTDLVRKIGGFRVGFEGSQDYDLMLRACEHAAYPPCRIASVLYQWRVHQRSTSTGIAAKPYAIAAAVKAISEALDRRGRPARVEFVPGIEHYRVRFPIPEKQPLISIIIPNRDSPKLLQVCIESLFERTSYKNFEVIVVDNGSSDASVGALYQKFRLKYDGRFSVLEAPGVFNFGRLNNQAAKHAQGDYLVLLNNDTEVLTPDWLEEMLSWAQLPEIGAVGAKLLFDDDTIQHAGLVLLGDKIAGSAFERMPKDSSYYYNLINTAREVSAVTAACLMVKKQNFVAVEGLDDTMLPNGYGDVDFCLKLARLGRGCFYTPYAVLRHFESATRGQAIEHFEREIMMQRWGALLVDDPYFSPALERHARYRVSGYPSADLDGQEFRRLLQQARWFTQVTG